MRESPRPEQKYFIYAFCQYIIIDIIELLNFMNATSVEQIKYMAIAWYLLILAALTSAGFALILKFKLAHFVLLFMWILTGLYILFYFINVGEILSLLMHWTILGVSALGSVFLGLLLMKFTFETRLSPIVGLFLAIGIMVGFTGLELFIPMPFDRLWIRLAMLVLIYLGIKGKLGFWELTREEKIKRGIPVMVEEGE
jgi:hypothetical protein